MNILSLCVCVCVFQDKWVPHVFLKGQISHNCLFRGSGDEGSFLLLHYACFNSPRSHKHIHTHAVRPLNLLTT